MIFGQYAWGEQPWGALAPNDGLAQTAQPIVLQRSAEGQDRVIAIEIYPYQKTGAG